MNCEYLVKQNNCKFKAKFTYLEKHYCTRHYNYLNKQSNTEQNNSNSKEQNNITEQNNDIKESNDIILELFKYTDIKLLQTESFINIYLVTINDTKFIVKYQDLKTNSKNLLYYEYLLLSNNLINNDLFVNIHYINEKAYYYKKNEYVLFCQEYLYYSLNTKKINYTFTLDEILNIGKQLLKIIEYIHSKKYIYLNLKPENIMFLNETNLKIKLIDFNLCDKYINLDSNFYPNCKLNDRKNNDIFGSININLSNRGCRFDDIESILYILLYLLDDNKFLSILNQKNISNIILIKEHIFNSYKSQYDFINNLITEIKNTNTIEHKKPNYKKIIEILC